MIRYKQLPPWMIDCLFFLQGFSVFLHIAENSQSLLKNMQISTLANRCFKSKEGLSIHTRGPDLCQADPCSCTLAFVERRGQT